MEKIFLNQTLDKNTTKKLLSWFLDNYSELRLGYFLDEMKSVGFHFATKAGFSLGFDDLRIPDGKERVLKQAELETFECENDFIHAKINSATRYQRLLAVWASASDSLKDEVTEYFEETDFLNPLYMMAFSGARGNISQVRQLIGMRGLMSDSSGGVIDFPIRSNFREGLSVTEYAISCYGARKGLIDTALRTADSGYLTRRLVDVAQKLVIGRTDCGTNEYFLMYDLRNEERCDPEALLIPAEDRVLGRLLGETVYFQDRPISNYQPYQPYAHPTDSSWQLFKNRRTEPLALAPSGRPKRGPVGVHDRNPGSSIAGTSGQKGPGVLELNRRFPKRVWRPKVQGYGPQDRTPGPLGARALELLDKTAKFSKISGKPIPRWFSTTVFHVPKSCINIHKSYLPRDTFILRERAGKRALSDRTLTRQEVPDRTGSSKASFGRSMNGTPVDPNPWTWTPLGSPDTLRKPSVQFQNPWPLLTGGPGDRRSRVTVMDPSPGDTGGVQIQEGLENRRPALSRLGLAPSSLPQCSTLHTKVTPIEFEANGASRQFFKISRSLSFYRFSNPVLLTLVDYESRVKKKESKQPTGVALNTQNASPGYGPGLLLLTSIEQLALHRADRSELEGVEEGLRILPARGASKTFGSETVGSETFGLEPQIVARTESISQHENLQIYLLGVKNEEILPDLLEKVSEYREPNQGIPIRSALTCRPRNVDWNSGRNEDICQYCYGWNLATGRLVVMGEAVGILAAQSIGEPGTQLTMRTFHTGGVFSGEVEAKVFAPHGGFVSFSRKPSFPQFSTVLGQKAFFITEELQIKISQSEILPHSSDTNFIQKYNEQSQTSGKSLAHFMGGRESKVSEVGSDLQKNEEQKLTSILELPPYSYVFIFPGQKIERNQVCAEISKNSGIPKKAAETFTKSKPVRLEIQGQIGRPEKEVRQFENGKKKWITRLKERVGSSETSTIGFHSDYIWVFSGKPVSYPQIAQTGDYISPEIGSLCKLNLSGCGSANLLGSKGVISFEKKQNFFTKRRSQVGVFTSTPFMRASKDIEPALQRSSLLSIQDSETNNFLSFLTYFQSSHKIISKKNHLNSDSRKQKCEQILREKSSQPRRPAVHPTSAHENLYKLGELWFGVKEEQTAAPGPSGATGTQALAQAPFDRRSRRPLWGPGPVRVHDRNPGPSVARRASETFGSVPEPLAPFDRRSRRSKIQGYGQKVSKARLEPDAEQDHLNEQQLEGSQQEKSLDSFFDFADFEKQFYRLLFFFETLERTANETHSSCSKVLETQQGSARLWSGPVQPFLRLSCDSLKPFSHLFWKDFAYCFQQKKISAKNTLFVHATFTKLLFSGAKYFPQFLSSFGKLWLQGHTFFDRSDEKEKLGFFGISSNIFVPDPLYHERWNYSLFDRYSLFERWNTYYWTKSIPLFWPQKANDDLDPFLLNEHSSENSLQTGDSFHLESSRRHIRNKSEANGKQDRRFPKRIFAFPLHVQQEPEDEGLDSSAKPSVATYHYLLSLHPDFRTRLLFQVESVFAENFGETDFLLDVPLGLHGLRFLRDRSNLEYTKRMTAASKNASEMGVDKTDEDLLKSPKSLDFLQSEGKAFLELLFNANPKLANEKRISYPEFQAGQELNQTWDRSDFDSRTESFQTASSTRPPSEVGFKLEAPKLTEEFYSSDFDEKPFRFYQNLVNHQKGILDWEFRKWIIGGFNPSYRSSQTESKSAGYFTKTRDLNAYPYNFWSFAKKLHQRGWSEEMVKVYVYSDPFIEGEEPSLKIQTRTKDWCTTKKAVWKNSKERMAFQDHIPKGLELSSELIERATKYKFYHLMRRQDLGSEFRKEWRGSPQPSVWSTQSENSPMTPEDFVELRFSQGNKEVFPALKLGEFIGPKVSFQGGLEFETGKYIDFLEDQVGLDSSKKDFFDPQNDSDNRGEDFIFTTTAKGLDEEKIQSVDYGGGFWETSSSDKKLGNEEEPGVRSPSLAPNSGSTVAQILEPDQYSEAGEITLGEVEFFSRKNRNRPVFGEIGEIHTRNEGNPANNSENTGAGGEILLSRQHNFSRIKESQLPEYNFVQFTDLRLWNVPGNLFWVQPSKWQPILKKASNSHREPIRSLFQGLGRDRRLNWSQLPSIRKKIQNGLSDPRIFGRSLGELTVSGFPFQGLKSGLVLREPKVSEAHSGSSEPATRVSTKNATSNQISFDKSTQILRRTWIAKTYSLSYTLRLLHPYRTDFSRGNFELREKSLEVREGEILKSQEFLFSQSYQESRTGDIVQGLPKIEQLFEARRSSPFTFVTLHQELKKQFTSFCEKFPPLHAARLSLRFIQRVLVDEIQLIYHEQGVDIHDKHIELVVRQMTRRVAIRDAGTTHFLPSSVVELETLERYAAGRKNKFQQYQKSSFTLVETGLVIEPVILGLTKTSLVTTNFLSAASFQEARRMLFVAATKSSVDFLSELKHDVLVGRYLRAGSTFHTNTRLSSLQKHPRL